MRAELVTDVQGAARFRDAWDALAVEARRPYLAPAWLLSWWTHAAPAGAELRILVALDGGEPVGVAPFYTDPTGRYEPLAARISSRVEPLARRGFEGAVARVVAAALADQEPRPGTIAFHAIPAGSPWPSLLRDAWPGKRRPWIGHEQSMACPTLELPGDGYDRWFGAKSASFRKQQRRAGRVHESEGGVFRLAATEEELERDLRAFASLHYARWEDRGGSNVLDEGVERALLSAARELVEERRFRLWSLDVAGRTIGSQVLLAAGGEVVCWLGGVDTSDKRYQAAPQLILVAIEQACALGERRLDLGPGAADYKYRFADGEDRLAWTTLVLPGRGHARARVEVLGGRARHGISERLSPVQKARIRRVLRRSRRP
jgi:CelD/BcsL family acetyltransferase involved in cellulose biosynthesis